MKKTILAFLLLGSLLIMACNHRSEPIIKIKFDVTNLSERRFSEIVTYGLEDPKKEDFKVINFSVQIPNSQDFRNIKIKFPSTDRIYALANSYRYDRLWYFDETLSPKDSTKFVLYYKGLDENDIKKMFGSLIVVVSWTSESGEYNEKSLSIDNYIQFK